MKRVLLLVAVLALCAAGLQAGEKKLMHCFFFTEIETASAAEWEAFAKATDELPGKIPGLEKVWHGKLARPMSFLAAATPLDAEVSKKLRAGEAVPATVKTMRRQYGVCMQFTGEDALKAYAKHEAHDAWVKVYEKVRVAGTTTIDMMGK